MYAAVRCVVLFEAENHFGALAGRLAAVNLLAWSKVFHAKFYLSIRTNFWGLPTLMDSEHCHVDNQSGSLFTCLLG